MPNQFDDQFTGKAWDGFTRTQGQLVDYTPNGAAEQTDIKTVWEPATTQDTFLPESEQHLSRGRLSIDPAAITTWTPDNRDLANIPATSEGGTQRTFAVESIIQLTPVVVLLMVEHQRVAYGARNTRPERS